MGDEIYFVGMLYVDEPFFCYAEDETDAITQACKYFDEPRDAVNECCLKSQTFYADTPVRLGGEWVT
ncbi:hypothetical protein Lepto7375DRAFT_7389 [Leptolyngbya sp. PCC 7375]|nr:hypothetical protein Lepto7375DRAFT_7389 [Leptolyngbya sp. PCC 7375]